MDQVITYDKSLQQRLQEYESALSGYDVLPVSAIQKEWGFYLELTLDPNGWQAVWKIQRHTCEALEISYPSMVLVLVLGTDLDELTALVKVVAVQDDIHIPERHHVPLVQLWPTKEQDKTVYLNLESTANALDMLRFFYHYLFMPWDYDDDENVDWKSKHLEPRLRLYYDMKNGVIPRITGEHLHSLITEAKKLQVKKEQLEVELEDVDDLNESRDNSKVQELMKMHIRIMQIKAKVDILENPLLRDVAISVDSEISRCEDQAQNVWAINEGTAKSFVEFFTKVEQIFPDEKLKCSSDLNSCLSGANADDIFVVNQSKYCVSTTGALECGGILRGLCREGTILGTKSEDIMLDFRGRNVLLENVTIDAASPQCAIIVRAGKLTLSNCKVMGDGKSSTHQGILVLKGAKLHVINSDISGFSVGIIGNSGSCITVESSEIHSCKFGLKIYDQCMLKATKTCIANCADYGICVETEKCGNGKQPAVGSFDSLNIIQEIQIEFITGTMNRKGDAIVNPKSALTPLEDVTENLDSDTTVCFESDEDMTKMM